ncbi:MAG: DNA-binding response regulator [Limisphaera sp.]|nr:MAG: DNA-binding response regulator [Limisphaera sp.]
MTPGGPDLRLGCVGRVSIAVAIIEDDAPAREILAQWLRRADGFRCVGEYDSAESALRQLPGVKPDVVLVDINLPGLNGIECVRRLKPQLPQAQFVMLTVYEDADHIFDALKAGATGYLLKQTTRQELLAAVRQVHAGGSPMTSNIARKVVQSFQQKPAPAPAGTDESPQTAELSPREREVLDLLARGYLYKEIADTLNISLPTVNTYIRRIYEKLHVRSRWQAVARYAHWVPRPGSGPRGPAGSGGSKS